MVYSGILSVTHSTFFFLLIHIKPKARGQYLATSLMAKYKFVYSNCECSNFTCETNELALEAAKESLNVMHSLNPHIRYVMVARIVVKGCYSIIGRHEL